MITRQSRITVLAVVAGLVILAGCAEKMKTAQPSPPAPTGPVATPPAGQRPATAEPTAPGPAPSQPPPTAAGFTEQPELKDVFFDAGRAEIGRNGARVMRENVHWLLANPGFLVLIEGYSDYRGRPEANLAVGERRAKAAMNFLVKEGVPDRRITIVSYGSERPVCREKTEACSAKNRRVHFLVLPK
jgi:peptidoglycan-associated lipoprotein